MANMCPKCKKEELIEAIEVEVCPDEYCGYGFSYRGDNGPVEEGA